MLYCLVAEVLFLGMLFVASLLSLLLILFVVRDIDAVDDYMLTFMQDVYKRQIWQKTPRITNARPVPARCGSTAPAESSAVITAALLMM